MAKSIGVTKEQISITVKTAGISAVAPSVVIAVGMISPAGYGKGAHSLAAAFGCGNVGYELQSVRNCGRCVWDNCKRSHLTPGIFQTTVFLMAFGCIRYLVIPALLCTKMDKVIRKISGKDATVATIISTASDSGLRMWTPLHTENGCVNSGAGGGFAVMLLLQAIQKRTKEKMALEWGLLISMSAGMCLGLFV